MDGSYLYKAIVTDRAGNASETAIQKVVVDTTEPQAGELTLSDLRDTGVSTTDQITQDKNFNLKLEGQENGSRVAYLVSTDDGKTWQETTVTQKIWLMVFTNIKLLLQTLQAIHQKPLYKSHCRYYRTTSR